ncbi:hypothetical protein BH11BAC2_BH11BAC2_00790 [soil metagenome]
MKLSWRVALCYVWFLIALPLGSYATHLMGGNLTYQFLGLNTSTNQYEYTVTLNLYRYCANGSSQLPATMDIGLYRDDPNNPTGNKLRVVDTSLPLISQQFITPPNANDSCTFTPNVCVEEGVYQAVISVPDSLVNYYLISDRCCRNNNIANLDNPQDVGQAYFAELPPAIEGNSSPTFAVAPVPFICAGDTVSILNQASDVDGDSLVYSFVTPYAGISSNVQPNPNPPAVYTWPIPDVTYAAGFSLANPFGAGGYSSIESTSGLTSYLSQNQGFYVIAIEISEYRNGVLIGITRRDIQIIVITCPANPAPSLATGSTQTTYTIQEGQTLCFNVGFTDSNGDSLFVTHTGDIFNSILTNPAATLLNASGLGSASSQFCWTTSCNQGRTNPYQFSAVANDNGCPAKTTNVVYTINVINTAKPTTLFGPDTLCYNAATGIAYSVSANPSYTYNWTISQGSQLSGSNTGSITVGFNATGNATIAVVAVNQYGCTSDTLKKTVFIKTLPTAIAGTDIHFCSGGTATIGTGTTAGYTYSWSPATGLSSTTISNPVVTFNNTGTTPVSQDYIVTTTANGCSNADTITVTSDPFPIANAGNNATLCSGSSIPIGSLPTAGYTYSWSPSGGLSNNAVANPVVTLTNVTNQPDTLLYYLIVQNSFGCADSDTVQVVVRPVPNAVAGSDLSFCSGQSGTIGSGTISGYSYSWSPTGGLSTPTTSSTGVSLTNLTTVNDTVSFILTTGWFGCTDRDTVDVIVRPNPVSTAGNNQLLCSGNTVQLGAANTAGYTYSWNPASGLSNGSISNPTLTLTNTNSIPDTLQYVVTTTLAGCVTTDTVQVISSPVPTATAGSDVTFCSGQTVAVGTAAVGGYAYTWSPATGLSSVSISTPNLTLTNPTNAVDTVQYIMSVNWFGCIDRDTVQAFVKPLPVSEAGTNSSPCSGDTITLGTATTAGYTYSWTPASGLSSTTISNPVVIVNNAGPGNTTLGYLVTTTLNGCTTTDSVTLIVNPLPIILGTVNPIVICVGNSATLNAVGANTYNWALLSAPGTSIGTGASLTVSPTTSTSYIVTGTSSATCVNTDTVALQVNQLPNVQLTSVSDSICAGDSILLNSNGATSYSYSILGGGVIGTGTSIIVSPVITTTYIVSGADANLCSNTDTLTIRVNPAATVNGITGTLSICPGVTGVPYWINNPNPNSSYIWTVSNGVLSGGQGSDTAFVNWDSSGVGAVTVIEITDRGCQSDSVILPVNINVILTPQAPTGANVLCANQAQGITYTLLNTPGSTYNWLAQGGSIVSGNGTSSVTVDWNVSGPATVALWYEETSVTADTVCFGVSDTFFVTINPIPVTSAITGTGAICVFDSAQYNVTNAAGSTFQWTVNGGSILSGQNSNSVNIAWNASGTNTITVQETNSLSCTGVPVTLNVTVNALPTISAGSTATICFGDSTQLNATGGVSYNWNPSTGLDNSTIANPIAYPSVTTTYTVVGTDINGCQNNANVAVNVNALPIVDAGSALAICIGSDTTLNVTGGTSWLWSPALGLNDPTSATPIANPVASTMYTVIATDANGCSNVDSVQLTVNSLPVAVTGSNQLICNGSGAQLSASGGVSYLWSPSIGLNFDNIANPVASPSGTQLYTVTVTDINGCQDDAQVEISVNDQPNAELFIDTTATLASCSGVTVTLVNNSTDALNYYWNLGDGTSSTDPGSIIHEYPFAQQATITLIAYNNLCSDTASIPLDLKSLNDYLKNLPNVFSPNGDGINECLNLGSQTSFEECSSWKVFNRWGKKVFQSDANNPCWNGKQDNSGDPLPSGVYFYILDIGNTQHKGVVELIR